MSRANTFQLFIKKEWTNVALAAPQRSQMWSNFTSSSVTKAFTQPQYTPCKRKKVSHFCMFSGQYASCFGSLLTTPLSVHEKACSTHLIHKRMIHEVGSTDAEVEDVDLLQDGVVEGVQEPWCVRHLHEQKHDNGLYLLRHLWAFSSCALCLFLWRDCQCC